MNDDERPRSSSALTQGAIRTEIRASARGSVKALFIILTGVLVLVNAFFVIAEYSLVRSRKARLQEMAEDGKRGREAGAVADGGHRRLHRRLPGRDHDGLDRHRRARRAGDRAMLSSRCSAARWAATRPWSISVVIAYLLITVAQSIIGEIAPKLYTIQHAEDLARRVARPLQHLPGPLHPVHLRAQLGVQLAAARHRHRSRRRARGRHPGRDQADHRRVLERRAASTSARPTCSPASSTCTSRRPAR